MTKRQILELIEYLSWGFSGWGAVAALISGDLSYALIPLMFTVGFNLFNQQQFKRLHFRHEREIDELERRLKGNGNSATNDFEGQIEQLSLTQQQTFNAINQRLADLDKRSQQLLSGSINTNVQTQANPQTFQQRFEQIDRLAKHLGILQQQFEQNRQTQSQDLSAVNGRIEDFRRILQTNQTQLPPSLDENALDQQIRAMQQKIAGLEKQLTSSQSASSNQRFSQLDGLNQQMVTLKQQVEDVRKAQQQNISSFSQRLSQVDGFQQQLSNLQANIQTWQKEQESDLEALNQRFAQQVTTMNKSNSQLPANILQRLGQLDNLAQAVRSQQQQLEEFKAAQQQSLHMLNQKLFQLDELVRGRLSANNGNNINNRDLNLLEDLRQQFNSTQDDFEELRQAQQKSFDVINQRLAQLDALVRQVDPRTSTTETTTNQDWSALNQAQQRTVQSLNALNSRITQVDANAQRLSNGTREDISELRSAIAQLQLQVEQLFAVPQTPTINRRQPLPSNTNPTPPQPSPTQPPQEVGEGTVIIPPPTTNPIPSTPPKQVSISSLQTLRGHEDKVLSLAFSPNGTKLASVGYGDTIHIWHLDSNEHQEWKGDGEASTIYSIAFSPDGLMMVTGSDDRMVKLWDASNGQLIRTIRGHDARVEGVAFHPHDDILASCSRDKTVKLWSVSTGKEIETLRGHSDEVIAIAFSPRGEILVSGAGGYDRSIKIWHLEQYKFLTIAKHDDNVSALACSPDGKSFASGSWDKTIKLWYLDSGKEIMSLSGHTDHIYAVAFSPDGRFIASGSRDQTVKLWNLDTGSEIRTFTEHDDDINTISFSPNGRYLAAGSSDRTITIIPLSDVLGSGGAGRRTHIPMRLSAND